MSEMQYFRLVFRSYYTQKGLRPPKSFDLIQSKAEQADISFKFISTLTYPRLKERLFLEDIEFKNLPDKATKFAQIFKRAEGSEKIFEIN